jgi:hypothetical protein
MYVVATQPSLDQIYGFISKVRNYPISAGQLLKFARDVRASEEIVKFYERFAKDQVFGDEEDLTSRSEQVDILREEAPAMPQEEENSPEEY